MIYPRTIYNDIDKHLYTSEAVILTGMRRTGKTTLLTLIKDRLKNDNKLFLDLEIPSIGNILRKKTTKKSRQR